MSQSTVATPSRDANPVDQCDPAQRCTVLGISLEKLSREATPTWPIGTLLRMYEAVTQGHSALVAGRMIGKTRSAVIGKVLRLSKAGFAIRLHSNETKGGRRAGTAAGRKASRRFNRYPDAPETKRGEPRAVGTEGPPVMKAEPFRSKRVEVVVPEKERRGVSELQETQCRWPIGDPDKPGFHFCNGTRCRGGPYCETHALVAFVDLRTVRRGSDPADIVAEIATLVPETV